MDRRLFLQFPLIASALMAEAQDPKQTNPGKGFKVEKGKDRYQEELMVMGGQFDCKVSAKDTGGNWCMYDTIRHEKGGPALHKHYFQDEWFYIIRGEFIIKVGDDTLSMRPGDSAFAPRMVPHAFAKISEGDAQMLIVFQPAGMMEDFFKQMSLQGSTIPKDQTAFKALWKAHGMEMVGPPLTY